MVGDEIDLSPEVKAHLEHREPSEMVKIEFGCLQCLYGFGLCVWLVWLCSVVYNACMFNQRA